MTKPKDWMPMEDMPDGCVQVVVRFVDHSEREMCSCDYWHMVPRTSRSARMVLTDFAIDFKYVSDTIN